MPHVLLGEIATAQDRRAGTGPDPRMAPWIAVGSAFAEMPTKNGDKSVPPDELVPDQRMFGTRGEQHA
jgi:hypothetical protein